jgi:nicotinate-nucleotide pyrophosphorylase (carboxylating)
MDKISKLDDGRLDRLIENALEEDLGDGDVTTNAVVDEMRQAEAEWIAKQDGIVCGLDVARQVFAKLDPGLVWEPAVKDGQSVRKGDRIVHFKGHCRAILTAERTALNFAQRMSGISTQTNRVVLLLKPYGTKILDTRKTVPGLRQLDKYAVLSGGGSNHRIGLYDMAMVKDNHIVAAGGIKHAVAAIRKESPGVQIEVETTTLAQVREALSAGADMIMLDNMNIETMTEAVSVIGGKAKTEASGNLTIENIQKVAETGTDFVSSGALTHSVKAFDISQKLIKMY